MAPLAVNLVSIDLGHVDPGHGREPAFLVLLSFLAAFLFIRTSARLIRSPRVTWWPGDVKTSGDLHIHHLVWGITLLLVSGFIAFATGLTSPWWQITSVAFGIGAGLTLDEFALWLHLEDVYWSEEGRQSVDAVILATVFAGLVVLGVKPFGLDEFSSIVGTALVVIVSLGLAVTTFLKGRVLLGVISVFIPLVGLFAALRLAMPDSAWARRRYRGSRAPRLELAQRRFSPERPGALVERRFQHLIAGSPSSD